MSWTLVNRGLELFDCDLQESSSQNKESRPHTKRHGFKKHITKQEKAQKKEQEAKKELIQKQVLSAFEKRRRHQPVDKTNQNLCLLKRIAKKDQKAKQFISEVKVKHNEELEKKSDPAAVQLKKPVEESVFTDEDFERMFED